MWEPILIPCHGNSDNMNYDVEMCRIQCQDFESWLYSEIRWCQNCLDSKEEVSFLMEVYGRFGSNNLESSEFELEFRLLNDLEQKIGNPGCY